MGTYTLSNFQTYLKLRFAGNDSLDSSTNYYTIFINEAYRKVYTMDICRGRKVSIPELETTAPASTGDGTAYVSVPTACLQVQEVFDETNDVRLNWLAHPEYIGREDRGDTTAEGKPTHWIRSGAYIWLYPTPDAAYTLTVHYRKRPTELSGVSEVTDLGREWDSIILEYAHAIGRNWTGEPDKAKYSFELGDEMVFNMMGIYSREEKARRERLSLDSGWNDKSTY